MITISLITISLITIKLRTQLTRKVTVTAGVIHDTLDRETAATDDMRMVLVRDVHLEHDARLDVLEDRQYALLGTFDAIEGADHVDQRVAQFRVRLGLHPENDVSVGLGLNVVEQGLEYVLVGQFICSDGARGGSN